MQIKIFTIPILEGQAVQEELNAFLRSQKVLKVENHIVSNEEGTFWCFCVKYILTISSSSSHKNNRQKKKVDYKEVLGATVFSRFTEMRSIRKQIAKDEAIPAYAVFTDAELAALAKIEGELTVAKMKTIHGVGEKKVEKYGQYFMTKPASDEKS